MIKITFFIFFISILFPSLNRPEDGADLNFIHVLFEWDQEPDAIGYNLQVSESSTFNSILINVDTEVPLYIDEENISWNDSYYWRVRENFGNGIVGDWVDTYSFTTQETLFSNLDIDVYQEDLIQEGYVAIGGFAPELASVIIDVNGNEIWNDGGFDFLLNHINEYGNIYGFSTINYPLNTGMKSNTDMDIVWNTMDFQNAIDTHEIKQLPNGNYMAFIREYQMGPIPSDNYMSQYFQMLGYQANGITPEFPWYGQRIVEWNEDHEIVWTWNPFDHFTMQDYDNYEGTWYNAYFEGEVDWMHSNAFHFDEDESVIYVSHRHLSRISKISYPSGDVIWNMGLPSEYMASGDEHICTDLLFSFQHNIQLLENGDLIFFDNGNLSDMLLGDPTPISRIRRIRVIDDSYCETVWQYDLPPSLMGLGMGSVQVLENGNYSIYTFGSGLGIPECSVIEVTPDQEIIWKATGNPNTAWYRSYKIPSLHPDAFSVVANQYTINESGDELISVSNESLDFTIKNESDYPLTYRFLFSDLLDGGYALFDYVEGDIFIDANSSYTLSFNPNSTSNLSEATNIMLSIWPIRHEYALKELYFSVSVNNAMLGDINYDGTINILDVVLMVNTILGGEDYDLLVSDMNSDGELDVLDIVLLVNIILTR